MKRKTKAVRKPRTIVQPTLNRPSPKSTLGVFRSFRWYGFDLDGTMADNSLHSSGMGAIGRPIRPMIALMKRLHKDGSQIKIVTARVGDVGATPTAQKRLRQHIWKWCDKNLGFRPEITDRKDAMMECLYDDRARHVLGNRGVDTTTLARELAHTLDELLSHPKSYAQTATCMRNRCRNLGLL